MMQQVESKRQLKSIENYLRFYSALGSVHDWWDNVTEAVFDERANCLKENYEEFPIPGTNETGTAKEHVLGEIIADNGGSAEAYLAYSEYITH